MLQLLSWLLAVPTTVLMVVAYVAVWRLWRQDTAHRTTGAHPRIDPTATTTKTE